MNKKIISIMILYTLACIIFYPGITADTSIDVKTLNIKICRFIIFIYRKLTIHFNK
jgi:hypothetical protein